MGFIAHKKYNRTKVLIKSESLYSPNKILFINADAEYDELKKQVLAQKYIQADETPIPVLDKEKKKSTHQGYHWVYHAPEIKMVLFDYRPGRGRDGPKEILKNFSGHLQTDDYAGYEIFDSDKITLHHCMAHARRKFEQALDNDKARSELVLAQMQKLYMKPSTNPSPPAGRTAA